MHVTAHPSLIYALGYGFLTGLTPCVFPMIPITLAIFGVKAGTPKSRALALATAYDAGIALMFGALGPLAVLLTYVATTSDARWGFALLATYGAGVGLPLWLLSMGVMSLKPGAWMDWIKSLFGILFFIAALFYLKNVVPPLAHFASARPAFALTMASLVAVGVALGAIHASFHGAFAERARKTAAITMVIVGLFGGLNYVLPPKVHPR